MLVLFPPHARERLLHERRIRQHIDLCRASRLPAPPSLRRDTLEDTLAPLYQPGEKIITRSMVNNYVKQGVLASAAGKKYTRSHIAYLIVICTLKQTFSIAEIDRLIRMQIASFDTRVAYDYYCDAFEAALRALFAPLPTSPKGLMSGENEGDFERDLVLASTAAVAYTLYIKASIAVAGGRPK